MWRRTKAVLHKPQKTILDDNTMFKRERKIQEMEIKN